MIRDTDSREVARRLRELNDSELQVYDMTYFAIQRAVGGDSEPYLDGREFTDRLADLIEPSCDRDALLGLVKELELGAQCVVGRKWPNAECERMAKHLAGDYETIARRIREALGEE